MAKEGTDVKKQEGAVDAQESEGGPPEDGPDTLKGRCKSGGKCR